MLIIHSNLIPFAGYKCCNICGIIFVRKGANVSERDLRHEKIHTKQILETLVIGFYLWYLTEWLIRVLFTKDALKHSAYKNIGFEREAYAYDAQSDYLEHREHYKWMDFI